MTVRLMAMCVALPGSTMASSAQQPTFSAGHDSVRVDLRVTDRGTVVTELAAGHSSCATMASCSRSWSGSGRLASARRAGEGPSCDGESQGRVSGGSVTSWRV